MTRDTISIRLQLGNILALNLKGELSSIGARLHLGSALEAAILSLVSVIPEAPPVFMKGTCCGCLHSVILVLHNRQCQPLDSVVYSPRSQGGKKARLQADF